MDCGTVVTYSLICILNNYSAIPEQELFVFAFDLSRIFVIL